MNERETELPPGLTEPEPVSAPIGQQVPEGYNWLVPMSGRLVLEEIPLEERRGKLWLVHTTPQGGAICRVKEVPEENDTEFKVDDLVVIGKFSGTEVTIANKKVLVVSEADIQGRVVKRESK